MLLTGSLPRISDGYVGQVMNYHDAVTRGCHELAAEYKVKVEYEGKLIWDHEYSNGLRLFVGNDDPALARVVEELGSGGRAWTAGMIDLPADRIAALSGEQWRTAPRTPPLLCVDDGKPGFHFEDGDPGERHVFVAATRAPTVDDLHAQKGHRRRDPADGCRTEKSDKGEAKINAMAELTIRPAVGGGAPASLAVNADLFTWNGFSVIGGWGRADSAQCRVVVGLYETSTPTYGPALVERVHDVVVGGSLSYTADLGKVTTGHDYRVQWSVARPDNDGTRDRQNGVIVEGTFVVTA
ncbi:hypothetical protein [Umezawaea sp. NPDC059074]|uniref:hypothetical protein n=1 Tax=Umezawaea sp. NPDC059074 TaxID=3346716 RepID=UPI00369B8E72